MSEDELESQVEGVGFESAPKWELVDPGPIIAGCGLLYARGCRACSKRDTLGLIELGQNGNNAQAEVSSEQATHDEAQMIER